MVKWDYLVISDLFGEEKEEWQGVLNTYGNAGWELVQVLTYAVLFKRPQGNNEKNEEAN